MWRFLLTHPVWDVTNFHNMIYNLSCISTHTSRVGCDRYNRLVEQEAEISTHTSRVGCDVADTANNCVVHGISTHTSRVGCDVFFL